MLIINQIAKYRLIETNCMGSKFIVYFSSCFHQVFFLKTLATAFTSLVFQAYVNIFIYS